GGRLHRLDAGAARGGAALRQPNPAGDPDQGGPRRMTTTRSLLTPGEQTDLIGLEVAGIPAGDTLAATSDREVLAVLLSGVADVGVGDEALGRAGGRRGVFDGPGHGVYVPPGATLRLT